LVVCADTQNLLLRRRAHTSETPGSSHGRAAPDTTSDAWAPASAHTVATLLEVREAGVLKTDTTAGTGRGPRTSWSSSVGSSRFLHCRRGGDDRSEPSAASVSGSIAHSECASVDQLLEENTGLTRLIHGLTAEVRRW